MKVSKKDKAEAFASLRKLQQLEAYRMMHKALGKALDEIHNPGFNRVAGMDIVSHIEAVRDHANNVAPEDF